MAVPLPKPAIAVSAGFLSTCAVLSDGTVHCWGFNQNGALGNGASTGPEQCSFGAPYPCSTSPIPVSNINGGATAIAVSAYPSSHACAIVNGVVECWGENDSGQLGAGTVTGPATCGGVACSTTPVSAGTLTGVTAIATGSSTTCARSLQAVSCIAGAAQATGRSAMGLRVSGLFGGETVSPSRRPPP